MFEEWQWHTVMSEAKSGTVDGDYSMKGPKEC